MGKPEDQKKKRDDLQGLRGCAIGAVLLFHFFPDHFPNGYVGVDQFFVLSGFLMCMLLQKSQTMSRRQLVLNFYWRRLKRILPLYLLCLLGILLALYVFFPNSSVDANLRTAPWALFFASNRPKSTEENYFQLLHSAVDLFTHTWSLSVEIQFYLIVPFLFILSKLLPERHQPSFYAALGTTSFLLQTYSSESFAFNNVFARVWQFLIGMVSYLTCSYESDSTLGKYNVISQSEEKERFVIDDELDLGEEAKELEDGDVSKKLGTIEPGNGDELPKVAQITAIFLMFFAAFGPTKFSELYVRLNTTLLTGLLICAAAEHPILCSRPLIYLGDISYALYLIHWPICAYCKSVFPESTFAVIIGLTVSVLAAVVVGQTFEKWYLRMNSKGITALVTIFYIIIAVVFFHLKSLRVPTFVDKNSMGNETWLDFDPSNMTFEKINEKNWLFSYNDYKNLYVEQCDYKFEEKGPLGPCEFKGLNEKAKYKIAVLGNSWGANHARMFHKACSSKARNMSMFNSYGCEPLYPFDDRCRKGAHYFDEVLDTVKPDYAFMFMRHISMMDPFVDAQNDTVYNVAKKRIIDFRDKIDKKLYMVGPLPQPTALSWNVQESFKAGKWPNDATIITPDSVKRYEDGMKRMNLLLKDCGSKCELIDYAPSFRNSTTNVFQYYDKYGMLYWNDNLHLTPHGLALVKGMYSRSMAGLSHRKMVLIFLLFISASPDPIRRWVNRKSTRRKRDDLQGLRGCAIGAVLLFHFFPDHFPNGYVGVDQFFVLSGFLMCMLLQKSQTMSRRQLVLNFYWRRLKRILPLYLLCLLGILLALYVFFPDSSVDTNLRTAPWALFFASNRPKSTEDDYFQMLQVAIDLFTHTWSLSVEIQFYLIVPFLFILSKIIPETRQPLFYAVVGSASFLLNVSTSESFAFNNVFARYDQISQAEEGEKLVLEDGEIDLSDEIKAIEEEPKNGQELPKVAQITAIFLMFFAAFGPTKFSELYVRFNTTLLTGLLICAAAEHPILCSRPLVYLGDISYALYLIHWPICAHCKLIHPDSTFAALVGLIASVLAAIVVGQTFEKWYLLLKSKSLTVLVSIFYAVNIILWLHLKSTRVAEFVDDKTVGNETWRDFDSSQMTFEEIDKKNWIYSHFDYQNLYLKHCEYTNAEKGPLGLCKFQGLNEQAKNKIVLFGNSWAANHARMFYDECSSKAKNMTMFSSYGCEPFYGFDQRCKQNMKDFDDLLTSAKPDYAFMIVRHISLMDNLADIQSDNLYKLARDRLISFKDLVGKKLYIVGPLPEPKTLSIFVSDSFKNGTWPKDTEIFPAKTSLKRYEDGKKRMDQLVKDCGSKCELIDYAPLFRNSTTNVFQYFDQKGMLYWTDPLHLSPHDAVKGPLEMGKPEDQKKKRDDLQGLRGCAIGAVLLFHFFPDHFPNGYVGVDQFFVLSGFLMCMLLQKSQTMSRRQLVLNFYWRRLKRILPLYLLCLLGILLALYVFFPDSSVDTNLRTAPWALFFASNRPKSTEDDYFQMLQMAIDLFTHTWSLSVEIQFYLLVPFLFILSKLLPEIYQPLFYVSIGAASFLLNISSSESFAFNNVFARVWQFLIGMSAYLTCSFDPKSTLGNYSRLSQCEESEKLIVKGDLDVVEQGKDGEEPKDGQELPKVAQITAIFLMFFAAFAPTKFSELYVRFNTTLLTGLLICAAAEHPILCSRPLIYLGDISYALYLIHWPVCAYCKLVHPDSTFAVFIGFSASILAAVVVRETFEKWYLSLKSGGITALVIIFYIFNILMFFHMKSSRVPSFLDKNLIGNETWLDFDSTNMTLDKINERNVIFSHFDYQNLYVKQCSYTSAEKGPLGICDFQDLNKRARNKIVIFGNSWAANHARMIHKECYSKANNMTMFSSYGCEPLYPTLELDRCKQNMKDFDDVLDSVKPDYAFMIDRHMATMVPLANLQNDTVYNYAKNRILNYRDKVKKKLFVLGPVPQPGPFTEIVYNSFKAGKWPENTQILTPGALMSYADGKKRMDQLVKDCGSKCELIDYAPLFRNSTTNEFQYYDQNGMVYWTYPLHLSPHGLSLVKGLYSRICEDL
ncbi:unnamed protein product [Caenorhabditis auriculariae]|uniref:Acyl_transf_3 domain-containing protein n=1 Tax=Caenorhabditis auriculariae TaxID=2777116 RepID=A0A8S1HBK1_9PELO|nr:unnamed protein product [Caenorhabditis auriculariae]